jgi:hypothetical protein
MARWSSAEQRRFLEIAAASKSFEEIVTRTGKTPKGIREMAVKSGIALPRTGPGPVNKSKVKR